MVEEFVQVEQINSSVDFSILSIQVLMQNKNCAPLFVVGINRMTVALAVGEKLEESFVTFRNDISNLLTAIFDNGLLFNNFVSIKPGYRVHW